MICSRWPARCMYHCLFSATNTLGLEQKGHRLDFTVMIFLCDFYAVTKISFLVFVNLFTVYKISSPSGKGFAHLPHFARMISAS